MFGKKNSDRSTSSRSGSETMLGTGLKAQGTLSSASNIYIDGEFSGEIDCKATVVINRGACVSADICASILVVHGEVAGDLNVKERLEIGATGKITGNVRAGSARVAEGGTLDGNCSIVPERAATAEKVTETKIKAVAE